MRADYRRSARCAYRSLLAVGDGRLPVDVFALLGKCKNTQVRSYGEVARLTGITPSQVLELLPSFQACTIRRERDGAARYLVLYNDDPCFANWGSLRWSLAHELGHIVLRHEAESPEAEREANCFAQHLLCPRPVLESMDTRDAAKVASAFGLSLSAAAVAAGAGRFAMEANLRSDVARLFGLA